MYAGFNLTAEQQRLAKEQEIMNARIQRRVRQTTELNKDELMEDVKFLRKGKHEQSARRKMLMKDNEVETYHNLVFLLQCE